MGGLGLRRLVHDHWSASRKYTYAHACDNAHHLRERIAITHTSPHQIWAAPMIALLCEANDAVIAARAASLKALPAPALDHIQARDDAIPTAAAALNPPRQRRPGRPGRRSRVKQSPPFNLIVRLREHRDDVLRFLNDLRIRFDNNQAYAARGISWVMPHPRLCRMAAHK
jgi:transposase